MGMYTELVIKADVKRDISVDVKFILNFLFNHEMDIDIWDNEMNLKPEIKLPDHSFFKTSNWTAIGRCNSYYHIPSTFSFFDGKYLFSRSDLKNYDNEINKFIDWLCPYLDVDAGKCIGWSWYEEWHEPTLLYMNGQHDEEF